MLEADRRQREGWLARAIAEDLSAEEQRVLMAARGAAAAPGRGLIGPAPGRAWQAGRGRRARGGTKALYPQTG